MQTTSLALDWVSSEQIFAMLLCLFLAYIGYKMRSWTFTVISSLGWLIIGLNIYQATEDSLIFCLIFAIAVGQAFLIFFSKGDNRWQTYRSIPSSTF